MAQAAGVMRKDDASGAAVAVAANVARVTTGRPKSLSLGYCAAHVLARACRLAREATGLSQTELAVALDTQRTVVARHESNDDSGGYAPTLRHMLSAPDEYLDALLSALATERMRRGHAVRQWIAAPAIKHGCDRARSDSLIRELTDVLRARAAARLDHREASREIREAIEALQEALAFHEGQA